MRNLLLIVVTLVALPIHAGEIHCKHLPFGIPEGTPETNDLVFRSCYVLSSNDDTKFADWVAYRLTLTEVGGEVALDRNFRADELLKPEETLEPEDYDGAFAAHTYHKGHLAPLASFKGTPYASEVNYLSNIVPQRATLNGGPWRVLEDAVRELVRVHRTVWVITGPIYDDGESALPESDEMHLVPDAFFKVIIVEEAGETRVAAFLMEQEIPGGTHYSDCLVTIAEIQALAGITLFPEMEAGLLAVKDEVWVAEWRRDAN
ncbi:MAG: endonuclease [Planctomyces sp.]|nr:endonuclease [Planctomyces sp.]